MIKRITNALNRLSKLPKNRYLPFIKNKALAFVYKKIKSTKVAYPVSIMLELTNKCNLTCTTCARGYDYGKQMNTGFMDENCAKKIVDELWGYLYSIGLTGMGETFLYPNIKNIVDYIKAKNKNITIFVSTNAMLPNFIEQVAPLAGLIDKILVSIDGLDDVYESIRQKAKFERLKSNLETLIKNCHNTSTSITLNMVVTKENYHQMADLVIFAKNVGVKYLGFTKFNLAAVTQIDKTYYDFYKSEEFLTAFDLLKETEKQVKEVEVSYHTFDTNHSFQACPFPWNNFYITWDGYMPPCCAKPFPKELHFGNVFDSSVIEVLNSKEYRNWRQCWYENKSPAFCDKCHFIV